MRKKTARWGILFMFPGLLGFLFFVLVPVCITAHYAVMDGSHRFILFANLTRLFDSAAFWHAIKNTGLYLAVGSSLSIICAVVLAWLLFGIISFFPRLAAAIRTLYLVPLVIPSSICVLFAHMLFSNYGLVNRWSGMTIDFLRTEPYTFWVLVLIYIYKTTGYFVVIFLLAFMGISRDVYESARCEGAGGFQLLHRIVFPQIVPTLFFVFIMSIVNVFKMSRESWLLFGDYPNVSAYMYQNFIKNNLDNMNYSRAATASLLLLVLFSILVAFLVNLSERGDGNGE